MLVFKPHAQNHRLKTTNYGTTLIQITLNTTENKILYRDVKSLRENSGDKIILIKTAKCAAIILLLMLSSTILLSLTPNAFAQTTNAEIVISSTSGGTTNPEPGTYYYGDGSIISIQAFPDSGYTFLQWIISGGYISDQNVPPRIIPEEWYDQSTGDIVDPNTGQPIQIGPPSPASATFDSLTATQNPLAVICGYGYTFSYQAVFIPTAPAERSEAIVVVKSAAGGSVNPGAGTYSFPDGGSITLSATANSDYVFQYWVASGTGVQGHDNILITENPLTITCGAGYTYDYQPVFTPHGAVSTTEGIPAEYFYAAVIVLVILVIAGFGVALMYRGKSK
jgi:hypothetical protein